MADKIDIFPYGGHRVRVVCTDGEVLEGWAVFTEQGIDFGDDADDELTLSSTEAWNDPYARLIGITAGEIASITIIDE